MPLQIVCRKSKRRESRTHEDHSASWFDNHEDDIVNLPGIEQQQKITVRVTSWAESPTHATDPATQALSPTP